MDEENEVNEVAEVGSNGNGHSPTDEAVQEAFEGARLKVEELRRPDGVLTQLDKSGQKGILQQALSAIRKDEDYRQELKTAYFQTAEEADLAVAAINERLMCGVSIKPIVDMIVARSAGVKGGRLHDIFEALTHTTFSTNYTGGKKWWSNDKPKNKNSPFA
jgi:hypothetical protein